MLTMMRRLSSEACYDEMSSPVGNLTLIASQKGLHAILWEIDREHAESKNIFKFLKKNSDQPILKKTRVQLQEYFAGKRKKFNIPLILDGTNFQRQAWNQLLKIPFGKTVSYQEQAKMLGDAKKSRAVGSANGRNPISIIVPCHRVIAKNGSLTGFGGGIHNKSLLINLERSVLKSTEDSSETSETSNQ